MFVITKVEHALAIAAQDMVKFARAAVPIIQKVQGSESTVEALTALVNPNAVAAERAAFALLGKVCASLSDLAPAAAANGVNIQLDQQELADLKALAPALMAMAQASGMVPIPAKAS